MVQKALKPAHLVDQLEYGTNTTYLSDFIGLCFKPQLINSAEIKHVYLKEGLTAPQIAEQYGVVKSVILKRLHQMGIRTLTCAGRTTNPNNFRHHNPPYGHKVQDGKLVINKQELKVCRIVVDFMDRQKRPARETARELVRRGIKNRRGEVKWAHLVVQQIFKRWKGKL